mmetsp:Transcript_127641/g.272154  ORF Transcript_127641/g.272154 Transcript_127641/m.272154 type:complete len:454 (+) Transcript_127641:78-1439(+)
MRPELRGGWAARLGLHWPTSLQHEASGVLAAWQAAAPSRDSALSRLWTGIEPGGHPENYRLLRHEDMASWVVFGVVFVVLIIFDNSILHRHQETMSFGKASLCSVFWFACAGLFCGYVYMVRGPQDAFDWGTGYLLEWMLSIDNLFVFRSIFTLFKTPDDQKHKPLFWGIIGAIVFRMAFFVIEELAVANFSWMHLLLGIFLIYTGINVVCGDEEEANPTQSPWFVKFCRYVPFVDAYSPEARFFAEVPVDVGSGDVVLPGWNPPMEPRTPLGRHAESTPRGGRRADDEWKVGADDVSTGGHGIVQQCRATRLVLVVICLEATDIVFAVDSVSAIVAQIPDLFLAYTACVFAMLGLRATFFVVDELVRLFSLLSYAVASILIFLGAKIIAKGWIHIPPEVVCIVLTGTILLSIVASLLYDRFNSAAKADVENAAEVSTDGLYVGPARSEAQKF